MCVHEALQLTGLYIPTLYPVFLGKGLDIP